MTRPAPGPVALPHERVPYLDGLRGIAILLVVALHYLYLPFSPAKHPDSWFLPLHHLLGAGWVGVDLFFVLSGFLLGGVLMDHRESPGLLRVFYLRRACRILPAYFLFLSPLLFLGGSEVIARFPKIAAQLSTGEVPAWSYLVFGQNLAMTWTGQWGEAWISPTWSLAVEEQFYLLLPALILLTPQRHLPRVLVALVLLAPLLRTGLLLSTRSPHAIIGAYTLLPCRWDSLLLGVLAAWAVRDREACGWLQSHPRHLRRALLLTAGIAAALTLQGPALTSRWMGTAGYSVFAFLFAQIVVCGQLGLLPGRRLLEWSPLRWIGKVSYMLYLSHSLVCSALFHLIAHHTRSLDNGQDVLLMAASLGLSLALAALSWQFMERRILDLGRRFVYERPPATA